jgi:hypothetical protein
MPPSIRPITVGYIKHRFREECKCIQPFKV